MIRQNFFFDLLQLSTPSSVLQEVRWRNPDPTLVIRLVHTFSFEV